MPVALISHKYLRKNFGNADFQLNYVYPEIIALEPVVNPSHMPKEAPDTDEIIIFSWDAERRRLIAFSDVNSLDLHESDRHAGERHRNWIQNFSRYFFDSEGNPSNSGPVPWFTPASAKIVSYYFASIAANRVTA